MALKTAFICKVCRKPYTVRDKHNCLDKHTARGVECTGFTRVPRLGKTNRNRITADLRRIAVKKEFTP